MVRVGDRVKYVGPKITKHIELNLGRVLKAEPSLLLVAWDDLVSGHNGNMVNETRRDCYFVNPSSVLLEEIYNSPLYKALNESSDSFIQEEE